MRFRSKSNRSPLGDATYEEVPLESDNIKDKLDSHVSEILKQARDMTRNILLSRKTAIDKVTEQLIENSEVGRIPAFIHRFGKFDTHDAKLGE